jgi:hypothetical protein
MNSLFLNSINLILSAIGGRITTSEILPVINYFFVRGLELKPPLWRRSGDFWRIPTAAAAPAAYSKVG